MTSVESVSQLQRPDGTRLCWAATGEGPSVLFLHGLRSSRKRWDGLVGPVVANGFRAVTVDLRGSGDSSGGVERWAMDELVGDLHAIIENDSALGEGLHLVGHSLGGMLAQRLALDLGSRLWSLALVSTTSHNGRRATAFAQVMVAFSEQGFDAVWNDPARRAQIEPVLAEAFPGMEPPVEMLRRGLSEADPVAANQWRACEHFSAKDDLPKLSCPVFVTHGSADPLIPFSAGSRIHELIPGARWHVEEGAGHSLPGSRAESFTRELLAHLSAADVPR